MLAAFIIYALVAAVLIAGILCLANQVPSAEAVMLSRCGLVVAVFWPVAIVYAAIVLLVVGFGRLRRL
jgi:hypothetical protein